MTTQNNKRDKCEIYLLANLEYGDRHIEEILALPKSRPIAAVLLRSINNVSQSNLTDYIKNLQAHNIAVLLEDDYALVAKTGADGVHITSDDLSLFKAAKDKLGEDSILGVTAALSRHQTMLLGELGASYMALNVKAPDLEKEQAEKHENERSPTLEWWSQVFATPSVAWGATTIEEITNAHHQGADFICLNLDKWINKTSLNEQLGDIANALD